MKKISSFFKSKVFFSLIILAFLLSAVTITAEEKKEKTLYERLGGEYPIAVVVDQFIDILLINDVLNANPAIKEARDRVPRAGLKFHVTALVCQTSGGPCQYTGRSMEEAHAHLNITEREWQAMLSDFRRVLNNNQVPEREQKELIAIVESTKGAIVVTKEMKK
jgi:hemoglobin